MGYVYNLEKLKNGFYVYFISNDMGNTKIGETTNLKNRFSQLQTSSPTPLYIDLVIPHDTEQKMHEQEKFLHEYFGKYRTNGEWFRSRPVLEEIHRMLALCEIIKKDMELNNE